MDTRTANRITSIDILRGLVMVIMALDHTRDFFHITAFTDDPLNLATTTVPLYFTRWITHFCAPTFVFLAGTSAYLASQNKASNVAGNFLIKRGLWLVFIEVAVITLAFTFNPLYNFIIWQVIWATGWSMVVLGLLMRFNFYAILGIGLVLFFGHNVFDFITLPQNGTSGTLMKILFTAQDTILSLSPDRAIGDFYAILPWTGVMLTGYCAGAWYGAGYHAAKRKRLLLTTGSTLIALFLVLRYFNIYGDPLPWDKQHLLSFLNTNKYPPSLLYLCMTLGPALIALALLENVSTAVSRVISTYGRVPFFYYVLHFYLIHILTVVAFYLSGYGAADIVDKQVPFLFRPQHFGFGLAAVYAIWLGVVAALYLPCKWFNNYKLTHSQWWLKYL